MKINYTKDELIQEWLNKFPEDKNNPDLEQMALAGYCKRPDDTYYWASYAPHLRSLDEKIISNKSRD